MDRESIYNSMVEILNEVFEIEASDVSLEASLYEDLDLDSIDAIDLVVKIQEVTGRKVKPDDFKSARTVGDVVEIISALTAD